MVQSGLMIYKNVWGRFLFCLILMSPYVGHTQIVFSYDSTVDVRINDRVLDNPWAGGLNSGQYGTIDINGDGLEDLVVYDRSSNLLNTFVLKNGVLKFSPDYRVYFPDDIEGWLLFRDYDCDSRKDLFTYSPGGMRVFRNITGPDGELRWELEADPLLTLSASGIINLQVNITDIPSIDDVDGDGDLDILVYNFAIGGFIRYHQNMSVEKTGKCGALDFELVNREWGYFEECICMLYAFEYYGESCSSLTSGRIMHPGGKSLLLLDMDNDGDMDFIGGHEQCNELYYLENVGSPSEALMTSFTADFPNSQNPAIFPTFPAAYKDDFDRDGIYDLMVAPNAEGTGNREIDFMHSSWFYKNAGSSELPDFELVTKSFMQQDMIDLGANAVPALIDADGDGDLDLFIGSNGKQTEGQYYGYLSLFENTGNALNPEFTLEDNDYLGLSELSGYDLYPVFADFNNDQAMDLFVMLTDPSNRTAMTRLFLNQVKPGRGLSFNSAGSQSIDLNLSGGDSPCFTDVNEDGLVDLLLGKTTGRLEYYKNEGNTSQSYFKLADPAFLGIDDDYVTFRRNLVPFVVDFDMDGSNDLITSDYTGEINLYSHFQHEPAKSTKLLLNKLTNVADTFHAGYKSWITGGNLYANQNPVLILGNIQGGVTLYKNELPVSHKDGDQVELQIYPNPVEPGNLINIRASRDGRAFIFNSKGQMLENSIFLKAYEIRQFDIGHLPHGLYIINFVDKSGHQTAGKFIYH